MPDFDKWFRRATREAGYPAGQKPFPYQRRFAGEHESPQLVDVPTGCGKTAMAILGWLWRRRFHGNEVVRNTTPRRLVYCLPMRVLVEQTVSEADKWVHKLNENYPNEMAKPLKVYTLMGGDVDDDWTLYPERDMIVVGTQDMLLSRALNRGYAMSRFQWPRSLGLLNNDCLWVLDEVQLMGPGLATTAQLAAFRKPQRFGTFGKCQTLWMSATLQEEWLKTVDFKPSEEEPFGLREEDREQEDLKKRLEARKRLAVVTGVTLPEKDYAMKLAKKVIGVHQSDSLTLVVVNTVKRAKELYKALNNTSTQRGSKRRGGKAEAGGPVTAKSVLILIHSRFRPPERRALNHRIMSSVPKEGRIVVATQVVEAGVNISARVLFTELAPWTSLVQRFGRCNRFGEYDEAQVFWIDIKQDAKAKANPAAPYELNDLHVARRQLTALEGEDVAPAKIAKVQVEMKYEPTHVIRRRDLVGLFDTTPDLSGNDVDVSRFIRDDEERDVHLFWRDPTEWPNRLSPGEGVRPRRDELCAAPIGEVKEWLKRRIAWHWDHLDGQWARVGRQNLRPGMVLLLQFDAGGYSWDSGAMSGIGWDAESDIPVTPLPSPERDLEAGEEATGHDPCTFSRSWCLLRNHSDDAVREVEVILNRLSDLSLPEGIARAVTLAARCHDAGKAHEVFQRTLRSSNPDNPPPEDNAIWAKSPGRGRRHERAYFRHELVSALAILQNPGAIPVLNDRERDLVAYLVASHHGKVRLSIRSIPGETGPGDGRRYALGVWEGDSLPEIDLGNGLRLPATALDLSIMEMGLGDNRGPSWTERMLGLRDRDDLGPFRLAFLEALVRAADARASVTTGTDGASHE
jgi:CRISPR-associated endonuclease/helicase Cas3